MREDGICLPGLDEFERCPPTVPGDWLVSKPDDRSISVARQLLGCSEDPHDGLQTLLDELRIGPLGKRVAVYVGELRQFSERQAKPPAHSLR